MFELLFQAATYVVWGALCIGGYRYMVKNNPQTVAKWEADLKDAGKWVEQKIKDPPAG
jgi:hypothetical protein